MSHPSPLYRDLYFLGRPFSRVPSCTERPAKNNHKGGTGQSHSAYEKVVGDLFLREDSKIVTPIV